MEGLEMGGFLGMAELAYRAVWVRRLGCVHRAARAGGVTAIPEPIGLSVDRRQLHGLKKVPRVVITDGLQAYEYLVPGAQHVWCRFHQKPHNACTACEKYSMPCASV